jgi:hypothetical protein
MRPWTALLFALGLLLAGPALAAEHGGGHAPKEHASSEHAEPAHGAAKAAPPKERADAGQVGLTAALVLVLVGSGAGAIVALREQLG